MAIVYPGAIDSFSVPTDPENTSLSSAGTSTRDHPESHQDLGAAIVALETNAAPLSHDHSTTDGAGTWPTNKLAQANTHQTPDTDALVTSLHHTIGTSATQAAAGNHAHDYNGPSIFNKPFFICTTTTRPVDAAVGTMIYETDTNTVRVWAQFPGNELVSGLNYTYKFDSANSAGSLDNTIFAQTYPIGTVVTDGEMGAPTAGNCTWTRGANALCRCIAQAIVPAAVTTDGDDQTLYFETGSTTMQGRFFFDLGHVDPSPTNDAYLRMSADGQSYVRFSLDDEDVSIYYTTTGPAGEIFMGGVRAATTHAHSRWTCKAVGNAYVLYAGDARTGTGDGVQILAVTDYQNSVNVGSGYRGWGIGMTAAQGNTAQLIPNNITLVNISEPGFHTSSLNWQLLPVASVPHIRMEAHFSQQVLVNQRSIVGWDAILFDWTIAPFVTLEVSSTDIVIQEAGHYHVHASVAWDPLFNLFDHGAVGCTLNGLDFGRLHWQFMRGNGFAPGFAQSLDTEFYYYFAKGDVLRVFAQHNAPVPQWLTWIVNPQQGCWVELEFKGP